MREEKEECGESAKRYFFSLFCPEDKSVLFVQSGSNIDLVVLFFLDGSPMSGIHCEYRDTQSFSENVGKESFSTVTSAL